MKPPTAFLSGKTILITGGTGSLGKVLVRRILGGELGTPRKVVTFSRDEAKQHSLQLACRREYPADVADRLDCRLGDIRSFNDVCRALADADVVINAAALKQVPHCEYAPEQAVLTNCLGPANIVSAIRQHSYPIEVVAGISTDKACKPVSAMGMTKALQERILIAGARECPKTRFVCARYGNVLASRGSVIPLFHQQIRHGGPVTITTPEMTRFLMSLDHAVDCVFAALCHGRTGETFVPRMPSATILNIAKAMIGQRRIDIQTTGIRPGEKLHEVLVSEEECRLCYCRGNYFVIRPMLPELLVGADRDAGCADMESALESEYSSAYAPINLLETARLFRANGLLLESARQDEDGHGLELKAA